MGFFDARSSDIPLTVKDEPLSDDELIAAAREAARDPASERIVLAFYEDARRCPLTIAEILTDLAARLEARPCK